MQFCCTGPFFLPAPLVRRPVRNNNTKDNFTSIKVLDVTGRLVKLIQANTLEGMTKFEVNLKEFSNGMYTIQLFENNKLTFTSRIQKQD